MQLVLANEHSGKLIPVARIVDPALIQRAAKHVLDVRRRENELLRRAAGVTCRKAIRNKGAK